MGKPAILLALGIALVGCANYGSEKYFDRRPQALSESKSFEEAPDRATVYYYRQRAYLQEISYIPAPPLFYAVDGKMLSIMPLGSHVRLSLEPGKHIFTRFVVEAGGAIVKRSDVELDLSAGKSYYVGTRNGFIAHPFDSLPRDAGAELVAKTELAQFIHSPVTVDAFVSRLASAREKRGGSRPATATSPQTQPSQSQVSIRDALPSGRQVGEFLEVVATVALVALMIFGAAGSSGNAYSGPQTGPSTPPAIRQQATQPQPVSSTLWRTSSGSITQIDDSKKERSVVNLTSGVRYRIDDGRISGTDGSRYRVAGSTVFSDSGQAYQVVGNNVYSSDGRSCVKTGVIVSCK